MNNELLSSVLGLKVDIVYTEDINGKFQDFVRPRFGDFVDEINIHVLVQKCKIWAWKNGYEVIAGVDVVHVLSAGNLVFHTNPSDIDFDPMDVIIACQWIYDNKVKG